VGAVVEAAVIGGWVRAAAAGAADRADRTSNTAEPAGASWIIRQFYEPLAWRALRRVGATMRDPIAA
jgi:hypothetical protein